MANGMAMINEGLWRKDRDFQRLPRSAQCTFCQILSQKDLDTAGGLTLHLALLAKACDELTVEQLMADFAVLEDRRFLFVDYDTDELLVRSYVRNVSAKSASGKTNNAWNSVPKNARLIGSEKLRRVLASELRRLRTKQATDLADEIDPDPSPSGPPSDSLESGLQAPTDFEGASKPPSTDKVPELVSRNVVGSFGEENPRPKCSKHETNSEEACMACARRSKWDKAHPEYFALLAEQERKRKEAERVNCPRCFGESTYVGEDLQVRPCRPHLPAKESRHA